MLVYSPMPKPRPVTVTLAPPVCTAFVNRAERAGASYLKTVDPVPTVAPTDNVPYPGYSRYALKRQLTDVAVAHVDVAHSANAREAVVE